MITNPFQDYPSNVVAKFKAWHNENPHIYTEFTTLADMMRATGRRRYSARTIVEKMRWDYDLVTKGNVFKVNDDFVPIYARVLIYEQPRFDGFFELRRVRSRGIISDEEARRERELQEEFEDGYLEFWK